MKEMKRLSRFRERFAAEVGKNGKNGTRAVLAIHPDTTPEAAAVTAHRAMQDERVRDRIRRYAGPQIPTEITPKMLRYMEAKGLEFWLRLPTRGPERLSAYEVSEYLQGLEG